MESLPSFYTDTLAISPGETVGLHINAEHSPCDLSISRIGLKVTTVHKKNGLVTTAFPVPEDASSSGCSWPRHSDVAIPDDWESGYYELELTDARGQKAHHFLVVRSKGKNRNLLVLSTNTYQAYNYWGGYNTYADVDGFMAGTLSFEDAANRAVGVVSFDRPFAENIVNLPLKDARLVNKRKRKFLEQPFVVDPEFTNIPGLSPFDGSAGFIEKWEHRFVEWAEENRITMDYAIDSDLEVKGALDGYQNVFVVGHSEYWSAYQRDEIDRFVIAGGNLCIFSGNTSYWKVRHEQNGRMVSHKWRGHQNDPQWTNEETRKEATHLWSHPEFGRSEAETIGLSFLYGGYHRLGNCVARGQGGFTVTDESHWSLDGTDLFYGDVFGDEIPLLGYESDGCPLRYDELGRLSVGSGPGVPQNLEVIAVAPTTMIEPPQSSYHPTLPPENINTLAEIRFGGTDVEKVENARFGHAVIATFTKGKGAVFNTSTTEWVHGLTANDPFVTKITLNVLRRFGAL